MLKKRFSLFALISIIALTIGLKFTNPQKNILSWDNFGYYLYLPSLLIYHDLDLKDPSRIEKIIATYNSTATFYQVVKGPKDNLIMRYSMGIAIISLPAFYAGHFFAHILGYPTDGFSKPYQWAIIINGLILYIIGLIVLRKILLRFFSDTIAGILLLVFILGTNLFFFSTFGNDIPHVYVFVLYILIIWLTIRWHESPKAIYAVALGYCVGLTVLTRPSDIICFLIPLLWNIWNKESFLEKVRLLSKYWWHIVLVVIFIILGGLPQLIYWKIFTGDFIFRTYTNPGEGFDFLTPHFYRSLIGFRKGWFVYDPLILFALAGFFVMFKKRDKSFIAFVTFILINIYLLSSFTTIYNFGWRAYLQSYAVLIIPFGFLLQQIIQSRLFIRILIFPLLIFLIFLNLFQAWQTKTGVIDGARMTKEYYFATFLKLNATDEDKKLLLIERSATEKDTFRDPENYSQRTVQYHAFEDNSPPNIPVGQYDRVFSHSGNFSLRMDTNFIYSPALKLSYRSVTGKDHAWIRSSVYILPLNSLEENDVALVVTFNHEGENYKYRAFHLNQIDAKPDQWNRLTVDYLTPEVRTENDELWVYVWYRGKNTVYIDDFQVDVFEPLN
jgi:hypothetical protein